MDSRKLQVSFLSLNHVINDIYSNFLPQMLPFLVAVTGISIAKATSLISAFTISSAVAQPIFGYLSDKKDQKFWIYIGTLWMAAFLSLTGKFTDYKFLLFLAAAAGLGTAAFHPQALSTISSSSPGSKGTAISAFMGVGHLGWAAAPLIFIPLLNMYGIQVSAFIVIPAAVLAMILVLFMRSPEKARSDSSGEQILVSLKSVLGQFTFLLALIGLWSLVYTGLIALLPLYFKSHALYSGRISFLLFGFFLAGAVGGIIGGYLSDRLGRRILIIFSFILSAPLLFGFLIFEGPAGYILLLLGSLAFMAVFPVVLALVHELMPANKAVSSGICNGLGIGIGASTTILIGAAADIFGLNAALSILFVFPLASGILAFKIRNVETSAED